MSRQPAGRARTRVWLRRAASAVVGVLAAVWLATNVWLLSGLAERTISRHPERLRVTWSQAWMLWPGRVLVRDLEVRSQSRRQQWVLQLGSGTVDCNLPALRERSLLFRRVRGEGLRFLLRRRVPEDTDLEQGAGLPEIPGLLPAHVGPEPAPARRPGWRIALDDVVIDGLHEVWIDRYRLSSKRGGRGSGRVSGSLALEVRGPFGLDDLQVAVHEGVFEVAGEAAASAIELSTNLSFAPTTPRDLRQLEASEALSGTLAVAAQVDGLGFLQAFLGERFGVTGRGALDMSLVLDQGALRAGSTLDLTAPALGVEIGSFVASGIGTVGAAVREEGAAREAEVRVSLQDVGVDATLFDTRLARADRVDLVVRGKDPSLTGVRDPQALLELPEVEVPDLGVFARLVPEGMGLEVLGGSASARSRIELGTKVQRTEIELRGRGAELAFRGTRMVGDLTLEARTEGSLSQRRLTLLGARVRFDGASQPRGGSAQQRPVAFDLQVQPTQLRLARARGGRDTWRDLRIADGELVVSGTVQDLSWWEAPLAGADWLRLEGGGTLDARLRIASSASGPGLRAPSRVVVVAPRLGGRLGAWRVDASGQLVGALETVAAAGARTVRSTLDVDFEQPRLQREGSSALEAPSLRLRASGPSLSQGLALQGVAAHLEMAPMVVTDLSVFDDYLPAGKLALESGRGALRGALDLSHDAGRAVLHLEAEEARARLLEEPLHGQLSLDLEMVSDDPTSRRFAVERGKLRLEDVRLEGLRRQAPDWWGTIDLGPGWIEVGKPFVLSTECRLRMRDTAPLVYLLGEANRVVRWFSRILEIQDVHGTARLELDGEGLRIEDLEILGDGLWVRGRLDLRAERRVLMLVRFHGLRAGVEILGTQRDINVLRPERWFEERSAAWDRGL